MFIKFVFILSFSVDSNFVIVDVYEEILAWTGFPHRETSAV